MQQHYPRWQKLGIGSLMSNQLICEYLLVLVEPLGPETSSSAKGEGRREREKETDRTRAREREIERESVCVCTCAKGVLGLKLVEA